MIGLIQHHLALSQVLSRDYVWADPRIDCEEYGLRLDTPKEKEFMLRWGKEVTAKMKDAARVQGLQDKLLLLLRRELIAQTHPGLSCRLFLEMF